MKTLEVYDRDGAPYTIMMDGKDYVLNFQLKWYLPYTTDEMSKNKGTPVVKQRGAQLNHHPLHRTIARQVYSEAGVEYPKGLRIVRNKGWADFRRSSMSIDGVTLTDLVLVAPSKEKLNSVDPTQMKVVEHFAYRITQHYENGEYENANTLITAAEAIHPDYIYALLAENIAWK